MTSYRGSDLSFWHMVARLIEQKDHIGGLSLSWTSGSDWRVVAQSKDPRRDIDLPGVRRESDESDFDTIDTDID